MKITATSHKAAGGGLGTAIAAIIVWFADQQGVDMGPIADAVAAVVTVILGGFFGTWFAPPNQPRVPKP